MAEYRVSSGDFDGMVYVSEENGDTEVTLRLNGMPTTFDVLAWLALVELVNATIAFAQEHTPDSSTQSSHE